MAKEVIAFINRYLYDVERLLRDHLDTLKEELLSEDEQTSQKASKQAEMIMEWLSPQPPPLSALQRLAVASGIDQNNELSELEKNAAISRAMRSTGRRSGRPRDETSRLAVRALGLHRATAMSWREIALKLKGCSHKQSPPPRQRARKRNPTLSCEECGETMRIAVVRLRRFLKGLGYEEHFPLGTQLDEESRIELDRMWDLRG
jgi:hypothetical protein